MNAFDTYMIRIGIERTNMAFPHLIYIYIHNISNTYTYVYM